MAEASAKKRQISADSKLLFPTGGTGKVESPGSSSWLVIEDENNGVLPPTDSVLGLNASSNSILSTASSFESIRLDSSMVGSSLARSRGEIDGMSFCRLGASLLKQSIEKDNPAGVSQLGKSSTFGSSSLLGKTSDQFSPPFQKSEAYKQYQRSISSSESDSETEQSHKQKDRSRITDTDDQLIQVKKESLVLKEKLHQAELAIDRLQENQRSLMPTISKLESDVAVAIAKAESSGTSSFETSIFCAFEQAQNRTHWLMQQLFSHDRRAVTASEMMLSSSTLLDLEAGTHSKTKTQTIAPSGYIQAVVMLIIFFGVAVIFTMCLVPDFEMSQTWGWIPVFSHEDDALHSGIHKSSPQYREDPL